MASVHITPEIRNIIEKNPIAIATITPKYKPNVIGVAYALCIGNNQLLITDNFMHQTILDIQVNPSVAVVGWNKKMTGYKLLGTATYFQSGKYLDMVRQMKENKGLPAKGAILITVNTIIKSA